MMWLVEVALRRPISVAVMALLMLVLGTLSFALMPIDIFPAINIPVVMLVWSYPGLSAVDTERRVVTLSERAISTTVNDIDHIESESLPGVGSDPGLLPTRRVYPRSDCADQRGDRGYPGRDAARHGAAQHYRLQRRQCAGGADQCLFLFLLAKS